MGAVRPEHHSSGREGDSPSLTHCPVMSPPSSLLPRRGERGALESGHLPQGLSPPDHQSRPLQPHPVLALGRAGGPSVKSAGTNLQRFLDLEPCLNVPTHSCEQYWYDAVTEEEGRQVDELVD